MCFIGIQANNSDIVSILPGSNSVIFFFLCMTREDASGMLDKFAISIHASHEIRSIVGLSCYSAGVRDDSTRYGILTIRNPVFRPRAIHK